jgi:hypothetical protein
LGVVWSCAGRLGVWLGVAATKGMWIRYIQHGREVMWTYKF